MYGGIFGHTANSNVTVNMTNVVGNVKFVDCEEITVKEFGLLWRLQRGTVNMTNVYMLGTEESEGTSSGAYLIRIFRALSVDNVTRMYTVLNGADEKITETNALSTQNATPTQLVQGQYCFKDLATFKQSAYKAYLQDDVHLWDNVFKV